MKIRKLGTQGLEVSALGLGCMGMSWAYGPTNQAEGINVIHRALDLGVNFLDTAEVYGPYTNETLVGLALKGKIRQNVIVATKFGFVWNDKNDITGLNSSSLHIKKSIEGSLKRLNTDYIDLYYQHRLDPNIPIEETVGLLADFVKAGKVRYIGLSEVGPGTIRRAHKVHPITAVQSEYSLWDRGIEENVLPTLRELEIGLVPYSPIGRGFLTGKIQGLHELDQSDFRHSLPKFSADNFDHNHQLVNLLKEIANENRVSVVQIALAWLLRKDPNLVPIPGTKRIDYLEENVKTVDIHLPLDVWNQIDEFLVSFEFQGERYPETILKFVDTSL